MAEEGHPREWVYNWFSRSGDAGKARVFARNHRYKLYDSGAFYEIPADYEEQNSLKFEDLDSAARANYQMFKNMLDHYGKKIEENS